MNLLQRMLSSNSIGAWLLALGTTVAAVAIFVIVKKIAVHRIKARGRRTTTRIDDLFLDMLAATYILLLVPLAVYIGAQFLILPARIERLVGHVTIVALLIQVAIWGNHAIVFWLSESIKQKMEKDAAGATTLSVLGFIARLTLVSVIVLLVLGNLGFNISGLLAGLGIGGIAVALAAQNILGDLFASLSIALDKPFLIGDFIIVGDKLGTVEYIGLKTTRIRSLSGEQIVFSNTDLLKNPIRNYKRMFERRVVFALGVVYQTPEEKLAKIPPIIREIIASQEKARFDRAHFKEYGDFALVFEIVYYVQDPDYNIYMDIQQAINLAIFRRFAAEDIQFAYPTQALYVYKAADSVVT